MQILKRLGNDAINNGHLGSGLEKRIAIFVESRGESQVDSAAASQDGFVFIKKMEIFAFVLKIHYLCIKYEIRN